jgi:hypothetical protein
MTRFAELRRIEKAIELKNERDLCWAIDYCETRLEHATLREHEKHWRGLLDKARAALDDVRRED